MLFAGNIVRQPCMRGVEYRSAGELPNTDIVMNDLFWLGTYPGLDENVIAYMAETLGDALSVL
jgi:CDP-6-deoxy-D-xylo-4-hexulose-3-dehydrase